jgi:hypothetical protein
MLLCLAAAAALAGCNKEDHTIVAGPETADNEANVATNAPIELPPPIAASKTYRCTDNSVVYIDWLADNKTANIRTETNGEPTQVVAPEAGKPMTGTAGFTLTGSATASSITLVRPGHASTSCKA